MLSILIPTYNRAHLIEETVAHALAGLGPDDELILRDNASTDASPVLLRSLAARDTRIRLELATVNAGPVMNWLDCLRLARGSHVKLLFSDDLLFDDAFRRFSKACIEQRHAVAFAAAMIGSTPEVAVPEFVLDVDGGRMSAALFRRFTLTHLGRVPVSPSAFIFERELFARCFDEAMEMLRDKPDALTTGAGIDLLICALAVEHAGHVGYSAEPHVFFRQHAQSISTERSRLVKQLYNLARVRLAARKISAAARVILPVAYAIGDGLQSMRGGLRKVVPRSRANEAT